MCHVPASGSVLGPTVESAHPAGIASSDGQTLHLSYPGAGQYVDAPFDGVDAAVHGISAPEKMTYSVRMAGRREIHTLTKLNGKALTQGSLVLSDDGKDITSSWWSPGRPTDKRTLVYEKKK